MSYANIQERHILSFLVDHIRKNEDWYSIPIIHQFEVNVNDSDLSGNKYSLSQIKAFQLPQLEEINSSFYVTALGN